MTGSVWVRSKRRPPLQSLRLLSAITPKGRGPTNGSALRAHMPLLELGALLHDIGKRMDLQTFTRMRLRSPSSLRSRSSYFPNR